MMALRQPCTRRDPQHDARSTARGGPSHRTTRGPERRADTRDTSTTQATSHTHTGTDPVAPSCSHGDTSQLCGLGRRWWVQLRTILRSRPSLGSAQDHGGYTPLDAPPSPCVRRRARVQAHARSRTWCVRMGPWGLGQSEPPHAHAVARPAARLYDELSGLGSVRCTARPQCASAYLPSPAPSWRL